MKKGFSAAIALLMVSSAGANAAVVVTSTSATNPYAGPVPTYDFETAALLAGGAVVTGSIPGQHRTPIGSTGNYLTVSQTDGSPAVLDLSAFDRIGSVSFLWGTIDSGNIFQLLDSADNVLFAINGTQLRATNPQADSDRLATFTITDDATQSAVAKARFSYNANAFEIDNFNVRSVPEPTTWLMMIFGFFGLSFALRSRKSKSTLRVRYT